VGPLGEALLSGAWGFAKGLVLGRAIPSAAPGLGTSLHAVLVAPVIEEVMFRHLALKAAPNAPVGATALPFGLAHFAFGAPMGFNVFRVADAAMGGYFYERSYRKHGLGAPVAAHFAHNLGAVLAQTLMAGAVSGSFSGSTPRASARRRTRPRSASRRRRRAP